MAQQITPTANRESLPTPARAGGMTLTEALWKRASVRTFSNRRFSREQIGQLLWAAQGVNRPGRGYRTSPSAGATFPLETYAVLPEGVFRYSPADHSLERVREGDVRRDLSAASLGQTSVAQAPLSIVFCAVYARTTQRYGDRGNMYVHMEAGHAAQNVHLQAVSLGADSVPIGAFEDNRVREVIQSAANEEPIYIIPVGFAE